MSRFVPFVAMRKDLVAAVVKMMLLPYRLRASTRNNTSTRNNRRKRVDQKFEQLKGKERIFVSLIIATKTNHFNTSYEIDRRYFTRRELATIDDY